MSSTRLTETPAK